MTSPARFLSHVLRHPYALLPGMPSGIINSARDWVTGRQRGEPVDIRRGPSAQYWEIDLPALHSLPAPRTVGDPAAAKSQRVFPTSGTALYSIKGARVLGGDGVVISPDNRVFAEFTYADDAGGIDTHSVFRRRRMPAARPLAGWYATLCYPSATAYAHWVIESLPRIRLLEPHLQALDGIFVPAGLPTPMLQSLLTFGVREEQIIALDIASHVAPQHLLVPAYCAGLDVPAWVPRYLRARACGPDPAAAPHRLLYVSRGRVSRRRVLNEDALLPVLERFGFEIIHPQEHAFAEQAQLFSEARVVVGPSGAAMFNALFCRPGGVLVELPPHDSTACHYYYAIAAACGMGYWWVPGSTPVNAPAGGVLDHADFRVNVDALARTLDQVLGTEGAL